MGNRKHTRSVVKPAGTPSFYEPETTRTIFAAQILINLTSENKGKTWNVGVSSLFKNETARSRRCLLRVCAHIQMLAVTVWVHPSSRARLRAPHS